MGGLFGTLNNSLDALRAFENSLAVSQNNVSNASTPGYARQVSTLAATPFDPAGGQSGGVQAGPTLSTQNAYVNQAVYQQLAMQGNFNAQSSVLGSVQGLFDVSGKTGVLGNLNNLFQSFSAWSATPNSTTAQDVLAKAQTLAQSFQSSAATLSQTTSGVNQQIQSSVQQINRLTAAISQTNLEIQRNGSANAGLDASLHASLESLSQLANVSASFAPDGTATVLLGGQTPLVMGTQQYAIQTDFSAAANPTYPNAVPDARILTADGQDVTGQVSQGALGGLLAVRNTVLPSLQGNGSQQGALNQLAQTVADRVNQILTSAKTSGGQPGSPLFAYNPASGVDVAQTLVLDPHITASLLAPALPGPPFQSNGAALQLANLGNSTKAADQIAGQTLLQFGAGLATQAGQQAADAQTGVDLHTQLLAQTRALQSQFSGVSLDAEAVNVMELQKAYAAAGKMVSVIDGLTSTLIGMVQ
jgi:flagellar hook-associated protein 1 FlgK